MSNTWKQRIRATTLITKMCNRDQILNNVLRLLVFILNCAMSQNNENDLQLNSEYWIFHIWSISISKSINLYIQFLKPCTTHDSILSVERKILIFTSEGLRIQTLANTGSLSDSNFPYASALTRTEAGCSSVMMGLSELIYFRRHSQIWKQNFMPTETENRQLVFYKPTELRKQYLLFNISNKYT